MDSNCVNNNLKSVTTNMVGSGSRVTAQLIVEPTIAPTGCESPLITRRLLADSGLF